MMASIKLLAFEGVASAAMIYDDQPIIDYSRRVDEKHVMGMMTILYGDGLYFFELERVDEPSAAPLPVGKVPAA